MGCWVWISGKKKNTSKGISQTAAGYGTDGGGQSSITQSKKKFIEWAKVLSWRKKKISKQRKYEKEEEKDLEE